MDSNKNDPPPQAVMMQLVNGMVISRCISLVADLSIADHLAGGPRSVPELAEVTSTHTDSIYRVLRTLSGLGIFVELDGRRFQNSPLSELLRDDVPGSVRALARWLGHPLHWRVLGDLDHSVHTGEPSLLKGTEGKAWYEVLAADHSAQDVFCQAMTGVSNAQIGPIVRAFDFSRFKRIVDVGGGYGSLAFEIARNTPGARVTILDLPNVIEGTRELVEKEGLADRVEAVGGSFLDSVPGPADLCVLKFILHLWSDEVCSRVLQNCREAMNDGGRVLVCEMLIAPGPEGVPARITDIELMTGPGGRERSEAEFAALFEDAGFELERVLSTPTPVRLLEARAA